MREKILFYTCVEERKRGANGNSFILHERERGRGSDMAMEGGEGRKQKVIKNSPIYVRMHAREIKGEGMRREWK